MILSISALRFSLSDVSAVQYTRRITQYQHGKTVLTHPTTGSDPKHSCRSEAQSPPYFACHREEQAVESTLEPGASLQKSYQNPAGASLPHRPEIQESRHRAQLQMCSRLDWDWPADATLEPGAYPQHPPVAHPRHPRFRHLARVQLWCCWWGQGWSGGSTPEQAACFSNQASTN
jgi:hypothetical protein